MGRHRIGKGGKRVYRKQEKRARKKLNKGRGAPIGNAKNWI